MKKNIILKNAGGELANQLWNYISVYSYSLEMGAETKNPSFFEYHHFFNLLEKETVLTKIFSSFFKETRRRGHWLNKLFRYKYKIIVQIISLLNKSKLLSSEGIKNEVVYLPPTKDLIAKGEKQYFLGWLFRNPIGLEKYRKEILSVFRPKKDIEKKILGIKNELQSKYKNLIGLHLRQGDYKIFKNGKYLIDQIRAYGVCKEYIENKKLNVDETIILITSDGKIDLENFFGLNVYISKENAVTDLFLLSGTDVIIGSDSSFGHFASWYGDIPHIILKKEKIDWSYYTDKNKYFANKYLELLPL